MPVVKLISCHICHLSKKRKLFFWIFTISVCVESKTREIDIFVFRQPIQGNFHLDSNKFMASPFSTSVHNNPSLIIFIIFILSMVRHVAYSEFAMSVSFLDAPYLSYLWDYIRKRYWKFAIHPFLIHILPKASCSYQYSQLWELRLVLVHYIQYESNSVSYSLP